MLNENCKERMSLLLGKDYADFIYALENNEAVRGIRVNTLKTEADSLKNSNDFSLTPLSYCSEGFILDNGVCFAQPDFSGNRFHEILCAEKMAK